MSAQLAQELLETIVGEVQGMSDLQACSLVSRSLVICSQRQLFRSLCLFANPLHFQPTNAAQIPTFGFESACDLLTMSPHLAHYVRDLTVYLDPGQASPALESVLRAVEGLTQLNMSAISLFCPWQDMPSSLTTLLRDIYVRPTFHSLSLTRIAGVPLSLILYATSSLRSLSLRKITIDEEVATGIGPFISKTRHPSSCTTLEELIISAKVDFQYKTRTNRYKSILDVDLHRRLRGLGKLELRLNAKQGARHDWTRFLLESSIHDTLQDLDLVFSCPLPAIQLPLFPVLRFLKLSFMLLDWSTMANSELDPFLSSLPSCTPVIESLILNIHIPSKLPGVALRPLTHPLFFSGMGLQQELPHLAGLEVHWHYPMLVVRDYQAYALSAYMKQKFRGAEDAGILAFS